MTSSFRQVAKYGSILACTVSILAGCTAAPTPPPAMAPSSQPVSLLLFGDHGYDLDYLEAKDKNPPLTLEQAIAVANRAARE